MLGSQMPVQVNGDFPSSGVEGSARSILGHFLLPFLLSLLIPDQEVCNATSPLKKIKK